ncbi:hypothetical protein EJ08DRAFT_95741 [Tothia fuscella]|uniref:F-box domain-containing protein n=1 Tax=Tothia fuscella TaxID=1048955 RepID=A0A9P4NXL0_9PEZI|nr:hypothetical protein EJ08DRAFT_95741 [Tothia fuscella]
MFPLHDLPNELVLEILEILAHQCCLLNIILTSKYFHELANPLLYRSILLQLPQACSWKDGPPISGLLLFRTFLENPKLGTITEQLRVETSGIISRELIALLQKKKLLIQWEGRLLARESAMLKLETSRIQGYLSSHVKSMKDGVLAKDVSHALDVSSEASIEVDSFRLYSMTDGYVSQAIALRRAEVKEAIEQNEADIVQKFGKIPNSRLSQLLEPRTDLADLEVSEYHKTRPKTLALKNELSPILTKAIFPTWDPASPNVDPETSEERRARIELEIERMRPLPFSTQMTEDRLRVMMLDSKGPTRFDTFLEDESDQFARFTDTLLSFLPKLQKLYLNIPRVCQMPGPSLVPTPLRCKRSRLDTLTTQVYL